MTTGGGSPTDALLDGIRTVAAGEALLSPGATQALSTRFLTTPAAGPPSGPNPRATDTGGGHRGCQLSYARGARAGDAGTTSTSGPAVRACRSG